MQVRSPAAFSRAACGGGRSGLPRLKSKTFSGPCVRPSAAHPPRTSSGSMRSFPYIPASSSIRSSVSPSRVSNGRASDRGDCTEYRPGAWGVSACGVLSGVFIFRSVLPKRWHVFKEEPGEGFPRAQREWKEDIQHPCPIKPHGTASRTAGGTGKPVVGKA